MMSAAVAVAVFAPLVGGVVGATRPSTLRAGRSLVAGCAIATLAALCSVVASGLEPSGRVGAVVGIDLHLDRTSAALLLVVLAIATTVASFARRALDHDGRSRRFFFLLGVLVTGSTMVVVPGTGWTLLIGWVFSGWALAGLVGFESSWDRARSARRRVLRSLAVGDVALISALAIATSVSDALWNGDIAGAADDLGSSSVLGVEALHVVAVLVVIAGASRSGLLPFHRWLTGTLVAPTAVSAVVHAGVVSGAGLLLIRFDTVFVSSDPAVVLAFAIAVATLVMASAASLLRSDAKGELAWSTVAQMSFMVVQCSVGAFSSAAFHIIGHAMYKATLFLGVGDTVSATLRSERRSQAAAPLSAPAKWLVTLGAPTIAVTTTLWAITPDVSDAGTVLIGVFAWCSAAFSLHGWLDRRPLDPVPSALLGSLAVVTATVAYIGGLRIFEYFVEPSTAGDSQGTVIGPVALSLTLLAVGLVTVAIACSPGHELRDRARGIVHRWATPSERRPTTDHTAPLVRIDPIDDNERARIRSEVSLAAQIIAPQWPLSSFVAVNPLGGLESAGFDDATAAARRWLRARTHLPLDDYRRDHHDGLTVRDDLEYAVHSRHHALCASPAITIAGRPVEPADIVIADLLHGPDTIGEHLPRTALERLGARGDALGRVVDDVLSTWLAWYVAAPPWPARRGDESFVAMCRRLAASEPRLAGHLGAASRGWIDRLGNGPADVIAAACSAIGLTDDQRVDEMCGHLSRLPGWSGFAKWRHEWAHSDEDRPALAPIDVIAVRAMLEAAVINGTTGSGADPSSHAGVGSGAPDATVDATTAPRDHELLDERTAAVAMAIAPDADDDDLGRIRAILEQVPAHSRAAAWLDAQEHHLDDRLLSMLDRLDPGPAIARPRAQVVFCIDVRSEGLRRHLEAAGDIETLGFAGFFGIPMRVRRLGWRRAEPRCPVLVAPAIQATEHVRPEAVGPIATHLARHRTLDGVHHAHEHSKHGPGAPFVLAETLGWGMGPAALARTLRAPSTPPPFLPGTRLQFDDDDVLIDQRIFYAEAVLTTMGLTERFAPLVVLCGHTSTTTNNAHATALECGACAGASGDSNARAVAALLNSPQIRHGLGERGLSIPDDTWFVAGLHDTASDHVTLLDVDDAPLGHRPMIDRLAGELETAGDRNARQRARSLPGPASKVRHRGADWAQIRPEWGLARNAAFIIGPRSMTAGLDLDGRAFLHTYDGDADETGRVLETIMTAPLVVGHWISAQYYFSTVDPNRFGAGDKQMHNPIGATGVVSGDGGDLRVGLPLQSTHVDGRRHHQPVRLLAVIQADLGRIETVIANNPVIRTLTAGSWLRIAGRSHPHEPWSMRTPAGTWSTSPRPLGIDHDIIDNNLKPETT